MKKITYRINIYCLTKSLAKLSLLLLLFFGLTSQAQTTLDFEGLGYTDNQQLGTSANISIFTFAIDATGLGDDITFDDGTTSGVGTGSGSLYDDNLDIGGITKWTISRTDGNEFKLESIVILDAGFASPSGTIKAFKDGSQVGATVNINFDGNQILSANTDFENIDEIQIEAADINFFIDDLIYSSAVGSVLAPTVLTSAATLVTSSDATLNGNITADGGATITGRGFVYALTATDATPTRAEANGTTIIDVAEGGLTTGVFSQTISSLAAASGYSYIAYATNSAGTTEGPVQTFSTSVSLGTGQAIIDFNSLGYLDNQQLTTSTTVSIFTFEIDAVGLGDDITYDDGSGAGGTGSGALFDDNLDTGGITKWTISTTNGDDFKFVSILIQDAGVGGSTSGTITAFKDGVQVGSSVNINFNGYQILSSNVDFQNIDEIQIEASDINFYIDDLVYEITSLNAPADLCIDAGVQNGLSGGVPIGGVYSGPGVTDDGNGSTYSFDPAAAGVGTHTIIYTNGGIGTDDIEVFALPTVTFTALADLCLNSGVQTGLGGGTPTGGVYSGAGVTDDGNGMTYSFDPAAAGVGTHTITYTFTNSNGCSDSASDDVEVFALPTVTFTAPADLCINAGVQTGLGGGALTGGVYSGAGVTDDGNGMTYSFDPAAAGVGTHTITYTASASGCTNGASDDVEVFALPTVTFTALADICLNAGVQAGLGGGTSTGGVYSGPGIADDGNGMTYSFDPVTAGIGTHTITYTFTDGNGCSNSASDNVEVFALPTVTITAPADLCVDAGVQAGLGGGTPTGGVYSGSGVTDDGNGMTYSFDPAAAGAGTHTITYTYTDGNSCTNTASDDVEVFALPTVTFTAPTPDVCIADASVTGLGGGLPTGGVYSGTGVTDDGNGMTFSFDPTVAAPAGGNISVTYTFTDSNGCTNSANDAIYVDPVCCSLIVDCSNIVDTPLTCRADLPPVDFNLPIITDSCGGVTLSALTIIPGNSGCPGDPVTITRTYFIQDDDGNMAQCAQTFTIESTNNPTVTPASATYTEELDANCEFIIPNYAVLASSTADCGAATITQSPVAGTVITGSMDTTITLTATDNCGRVAMADIIITTTSELIVDCSNIIDTPLSCRADLPPVDFDLPIITKSCGEVIKSALTIIPGNSGCPGDPIIVTRTYFLQDEDGNMAQCSQTFTIESNIGPTVTPALTTYSENLDANCQYVIPNYAALASSTADCGTATVTQSPAAGTIITGAIDTTITLTATDWCGRTAMADVTLTTVDNIPPTIITQNITIELDSTGNATIIANQVDNGSFDNCGIATRTVSPNTFICANVGENIVTLTVTDINGNVSTADAIVTVEDNLPPTAICKDLTVQLDENGEYLLAPADLDNGSTDNCEILSIGAKINGLIRFSAQTLNCSNIGENNIEVIVVDVNGNLTSCFAMVTVEDPIAPTVITQDITVQLDSNGSVNITAADIDNGSSDNCEIESMSINTTTFNCTEIGEHIVTLTVTDVNGNSTSETAIVTVEDTMAPTIVTQDIIVQLDANGTANITAENIDNGSTDNCEIETLSIDTTNFDCNNVGENTITLTVTDINGNSASASAIVTVEDSIAPTVFAQDIIVQLDANGTASITAENIDNGSTDNCEIKTWSVDTNNFDCNNVGENTVTLTVKDVNGNSASKTAIVTVEDTLAPTIVTQDITIQLDANGTASITAENIDNGSTDNCEIETWSIDTTNFDCTNVGENTVTLTVTDVNGNSTSADATVTLEDSVAPTVVTKNMTVQLDANGTAIIKAVDIDNNSTDNCGIETWSLDITGFDCNNVGENTVTLTVTDINGNSASASAIVTVEDSIAPTVFTQDITVQLDSNGTASITAEDIDNGSSDNCDIETWSIDTTNFDCNNVGENVVTLMVTDVNGNSASATATVTVEDSVAPTVVTQNITMQLDANGTASITAAEIDNGSSDNCGIETWSIDTTNFDCNNVGENIVTLTVTDLNGNTSSAEATVTVEDLIAPTVLTRHLQTQLDENELASITASDIDNGSFDNCEIASMELDITTFDCTSVGENTVILTVTDVNGNTSSAEAIVTVVDFMAPTIVTQNITVQLDANNTVSITTADIDNGSSDNCGIASMSIDKNTFDCTSVGENTVTLTITDVNGNSASATAIVTVEELVAPLANCAAPFTIQLDETGNASITVEDINNGSSDNCGIESMSIDVTSFDCNSIGDNTVTLTVTDISGNTSMCTTIVTVKDMVAPIVVTRDISVELDSNGNASITAEDIDDGSFDACGIASISLDQTSFSCPNVGSDITVTLTVVDNNGNSASEIALVTFTADDLDNDGIADSCDSDIDGDNVVNAIDNCPTVSNPNQADLDRNGIGDICDSGELEIPKGFSPNGDGSNDEFIITGLHKYPNNSIQIYNRYGNMVYESNNYQNYWDGISSGKNRKLPAAPYFYVLSINGGSKIVKGWLYINY